MMASYTDAATAAIVIVAFALQRLDARRSARHVADKVDTAATAVDQKLEVIRIDVNSNLAELKRDLATARNKNEEHEIADAEREVRDGRHP